MAPPSWRCVRPATVAFAIIVALTVAWSALAQSSAVQDLVDAAAPGSIVHIPDGAYEGSITIEKPLVLEGNDARVTLSAASGDIITIASDGVLVRFLDLAGGDVGVHVLAGKTASFGPARASAPSGGPRLAFLLDANATLFVRNDASIPATAQIGSGAHVYHSVAASIEAVDATSGANVSGLSAELRDGEGAVLARFASFSSRLELDAPVKERVGASGEVVDVPSGLFVRVSAPGHASQDVPIAGLARPVRLQLASTGATAPDSVAAPSSPRAPLTPVQTAAIVGGASVAAAAAAGSVFVFRSERRLLKLLALLAPLYTRLKRDRLLDQPMRERVHAHVVAHPGIRYRELQRALDLQNGSLAHHLQVLVREGLLREVPEGRAVRFYGAGAPASEPVDTGSRVLAFVRANPGATGADVARALDLKASLTGYHLQRLEDEGKLRRERDRGGVRAFAVE